MLESKYHAETKKISKIRKEIKDISKVGDVKNEVTTKHYSESNIIVLGKLRWVHSEVALIARISESTTIYCQNSAEILHDDWMKVFIRRHSLWELD